MIPFPACLRVERLKAIDHHFSKQQVVGLPLDNSGNQKVSASISKITIV